MPLLATAAWTDIISLSVGTGRWNGDNMQKTQIVIVSLAIASLAGCAGSQPYKTEFVSSSSVAINYNPDLMNPGEVQNVAQVQCDRYGKDAIAQSSVDSAWGLRNASFACTKRD
jgi:hypothetical protein